MSLADQLDLRTSGKGVRLRLRVRAGARRAAIVGAHDGALKLSVTAPPERGRANRAVLELLARRLRLPPSCLEITAGRSSTDKAVYVPLAPSELRARLADEPRH